MSDVGSSVSRLRKRRRSRSAGTARRREPDDVSAPPDFSGSPMFMVSPAVMLPPPSYVEVEAADSDSRPPPYFQCLPYETTSSTGHDVQLCSIAELPSPMSVLPSAPPTLSDDLTSPSRGQPGVTVSHHTLTDYRNPAFCTDGV